MNALKRGVLILSLFFNLPAIAQPYPRLDSILNSLDNAALQVWPVLRGVSITPRTGIVAREYPLPMFIVSSFDADIHELVKEFTENTVAAKLYSLLADPERDMYADALLFQLFDDKKLGKLLFVTRAAWINSGKRECDIEFWEMYLSAKGIIEKPARVRYY